MKSKVEQIRALESKFEGVLHTGAVEITLKAPRGSGGEPPLITSSLSYTICQRTLHETPRA